MLDTWKKHKNEQNVIYLEETSKVTDFLIPGKNIKTKKMLSTCKKHKNNQNVVYLDQA